MSVKTIKVSKNTKKISSNSKQSFIRLNLDSQLETMLEEYELKYKLLSRSDIIRMLLSEVYYQKQMSARKELAKFLKDFPKPKPEFSSEDEMFQFMCDNDLM